VIFINPGVPNKSWVPDIG